LYRHSSILSQIRNVGIRLGTDVDLTCFLTGTSLSDSNRQKPAKVYRYTPGD
jgi:hypothetical protein